MPTLACVSCLLSLVILFGLGPATDEQQVPLPRTLEDPSVRRVAGPSWLSERGVSLSRLMPERECWTQSTEEQLRRSNRSVPCPAWFSMAPRCIVSIA